VQPELPVWVTAASNPQTFAEAGHAGCHLLTHLLGQSVQELGPKIAAYRAAWQAAGHAGRGQVALMLHTLVGDDEAAMRESARGPLKVYLRSAMDLIRRADWRFPTFGSAGASTAADAGAGQIAPTGGIDDLSLHPPTAAETEALLEHAFDRYWRGSALIGSPARCMALVDALRAQGVDEIACLIDFGVGAEEVLAHLPDLHRLMQLAQRGERPRAEAAPRPAAARALSVPAAIARAHITHLQCTPSQAAILLADEAGRQALSRLSVLLVGGEALPPAMARALRALVPGPVLNMYGPTEATVWCSCGPLSPAGPGDDALVSLGQPLVNVTLHLRNAWGQECPAYVPGELCVGGAGLARGDHPRPALDAERFIDDPLQPGRRLYRTGDQVRRLPDGRLAFLGRSDHQVKIRGHRIELGEIEAVLARQPGVREAVVVACQPGGAAGAGEAWLQAFVTARPGQAPQPLALARTLAGQLPEFMLPRGIALRERLPTTPNGKVDRQALAATAQAQGSRQEREARELRERREERHEERHEERANPPLHLVASASQTEGGQAECGQTEGGQTEGGQKRFEPLVDAVWRGVLGRQEIAREANFFDLGGHSLAVVQVQRRLREATGIEIAITDMFRLTTVAAQARHLAQGSLPASSGMPASLGQDRALARRALRASVPG
jgi:acyl carrier protein